ncbi:MAG: YqeG family HAD IIIA-type phosphatase [Streptococcaceae bacterium]|jgi:HAD superfamily phosphatase (TIGR01668 family)|nr:YqeG family HAD IIIA-type phosphatase [Streptococcaceae bacterium]
MSIENYKPDYYLEAIYQLDAETLHEIGIKLVLADLDNTLTAWNNPDGTPEMRAWLKEMKAADIRVVVVSNNHRKRVSRAVAPFGIDFVNDALKPFTKGIRQAMKRFDGNPETTILVGDQRMTDIRAAHRAGILSVLVKPLIESDHWPTRFNRWRERRVAAKLFDKYGAPVYQRKLLN